MSSQPSSQGSALDEEELNELQNSVQVFNRCCAFLLSCLFVVRVKAVVRHNQFSFYFYTFRVGVRG